INAGLEQGDLAFAAYAAAVEVASRLDAGDPLDLVEKQVDRSLGLARRVHDEMLVRNQEAMGWFIKRLRGEAASLDDRGREDGDFVLFQRAIAKLKLAIFFGDPGEAIAMAARAEEVSARYRS